MNNVLKHINARVTGKQYVDLPPVSMLSVHDKTTEIQAPAPLIEYRIDLRLGQVVVAKNARELELAKTMVVNKIAHLLYGEVISDLVEIRLALYDRDRDKAKALINEALNKLSNEIR